MQSEAVSFLMRIDIAHSCVVHRSSIHRKNCGQVIYLQLVCVCVCVGVCVCLCVCVCVCVCMFTAK